MSKDDEVALDSQEWIEVVEEVVEEEVKEEAPNKGLIWGRDGTGRLVRVDSVDE